MKKYLSLVMTLAICVVTIYGNKCSVLAAEEGTLYNVIASEETNSNARVIYKSEIKGVRNLNNGKYEFSGEANNSTLYSNHYFTGKSNVEYRLENYSDSKLTVKIYKKNGLTAVETLTMRAHTKGGGMITLDKNTEYYLKFQSPSHFYGYVK